MRARRKFLADIGTLQVAGALGTLCQLLASIALAAILGARGQGMWISAVALQSLGSCLLTAGVPQTTTSQVSAAAARGQSEKILGWLAFQAKVQLLFGVLLWTVGALVLPRAAELFFGQRRLGVLAWWLCLVPLFDTPRDVVRVALQGTRRMLFLGRVELGFESMRLLLVVSGALLFGGPSGAVWGSLAASSLGSILAVAQYSLAREKEDGSLPSLRRVLTSIPTTPLRAGLRQGLRLSLLKNTHTLATNVAPRLLIQGLAGSSSVAYFHIAQRFVALPHILTRGISRTALPALAECAGRRDGLGFRRLFLRVSLGGGLVVNLALLSILALLPYLLSLLFSADYALPVRQFAAILALGAGIEAFGVANESFFVTANRIRMLYGIALVGILVTLPANAWLIVNIPLWGTAWGLVVFQSWHGVEWALIAAFFWRRRDRQDYWAVGPGDGSRPRDIGSQRMSR